MTTITGTDKNDVPYQHLTGNVLFERPNSDIVEIVGRPDLVAKFPRQPDALIRETHVYRILGHQAKLPDALTAFRGAGPDHVLLARHPYNAYRQRLSDDQLMSVAFRLAAGSRRLIELGIVHGDLTPSNVLLDSTRSQPYIIDFGTAILATDEHVLPKRNTGSPWPVPDVYRHRHQDDVWSGLWILLHLRDAAAKPSTDGRVPRYRDDIDKPIIALLNDIGNLREPSALSRGLYRMRIAYQAQMQDRGTIQAENFFTPSKRARYRLGEIARQRQEEFVRAIESLDPSAFAATTLEAAGTNGTTPAFDAGGARVSAIRRFLRRFLGEEEVGA